MTAAQIAAIRALASAGRSDRQIGTQVGLSHRSVFGLRKQHDIPSTFHTQDPECGKYSTYTRGCRCESCKAESRKYKAEADRQRVAKRLKGAEFKHGRSGYINWGCRCETCTSEHVLLCKPATDRYRKGHPDKVNRRARGEFRRNQAETQGRATRRGYQWTGPELEVASREDLTSKQVALMLGRTYAAVTHIRRRLRSDPKAINVAGVVQDGAR